MATLPPGAPCQMVARDFPGREQASDVIELMGSNKKLITRVCSSGIVEEQLKPMLWIDSTLQRTTVWGEHLIFLTCVGGARAEGAHLFRLLALAPTYNGTSDRSLDDAVATGNWELLGDDDEERNEAERKFLRAPRSEDSSRPGTPKWYKWNEWTICDLTEDMFRIELERGSVTYVTDMKETVLMVYLCLARKRHATNAFVQCGGAEKLAMVRYIDQFLREFIDIKWAREAELKHGRICMLCAPPPSRGRRGS